MSKRKKKQLRAPSAATAYSGFTINENRTLGPEASYEETTSLNPDATSSSNLADEEESPEVSHTSASLAEKYLLSGKYDVPIWRIAFLLLAATSMWIFIKDNDGGAFRQQGDWWAIIWTAQKCLSISGFVFLLLVLHSFTNWVRKKLRRE
jgi:hypothetical protein